MVFNDRVRPRNEVGRPESSWWRGMKNPFFEARGMQDLRGTSPPDVTHAARCTSPLPCFSADVHRRRPSMRVSWPAHVLVPRRWNGLHRSFFSHLARRAARTNNPALGWRRTIHPTYPPRIHGRIRNYGLKSPALHHRTTPVRTICLVLAFLTILLCLQHQLHLPSLFIDLVMHHLGLFLCSHP